ncbi:MAG: hypothetical protein JXR94_18770 [Candidatus Hydrogenedentes bacterium]|nr:hypothetical protein [Candidatus Hydrogenedentota bacterium]
MNGRTRVLHAMERKPLDRIPRYDSFWEDTLAAWREQGMPAGVTADEFFDWDIRMMHMDASLRAEQRLIESDGEFVVYEDRAGYTVRKIIGKSRALEFLEHVTKDRDAWDALKGGFRLEPGDTARVDTASYFGHMDEYPSWAEAKRRFDAVRATGKFIPFGVYGPWEGTWRHRGYAALLMDLMIDPDWVGEMAETQSGLVMACIEHCIGLDMKPDALFLIDDVACTRGLLFSPDSWRALFKPIYSRLGTFLHERDIAFWLHCCGNCTELIPDFIECGLDVLQPLQAQAGMDVRELQRAYGDRLTFWGNIDVTKMAGAAAECESEVCEKVSAAREAGGYMYHSDHSVPPEVSFERYRWIMELVDRSGRY